MTIAVDFDGTIVEHDYPNIGQPIPFAIEVLKKLHDEEGHILILWSVRHGRLLQEAVDYCEENGLKLYTANRNYPEEEYSNEVSRKINADIYIDDKNIGSLMDWGIIYRMIKSGKNNLSEMNPFVDEQENPYRKKKKNFFIRIGEAWDKARGYNY